MSFKRFDAEDIVISAESITAPLWTGDQLILNTFFTSSTQVGGSSGEYYHDIYQADPAISASVSRIQFSIAFADKLGSGSIPFNSAYKEKSPSATVYGQYRNLVLGTEEEDFSFGGVASDYFYVINIDRERYKEKLLPGTFNIKISYGATLLSLIDNSTTVTTITYTDSGRVYELISGTIGSAFTGSNSYGYTAAVGSYGKFLPDIGVILLNGKALAEPTVSGGLALPIDRSVTGSMYNNLGLLEYCLSGSAAGTGSIQAQSEETVSSNFVFIRARNSEFNYSTNPSNITGSGELRHNVMINSPQAYITTVGLYNDNSDLLAVAKLSRPLLKDFTKEALVRIKLDY